MNTLAGLYKNRHHNFILKIVQYEEPNHNDHYTFYKIDAEGNEQELFFKVLEFSPSSSLAQAGGIKISYHPEFTTIFITDTASIELNAPYDKIETLEF